MVTPHVSGFVGPRNLGRDTNNFNKAIRRFWWGDREDGKKLHTIRWNEIYNPISERGMGIRDSKYNNMALLAKMCRDILTMKIVCPPKFYTVRCCHNKSVWEAK